jgi:hypothetical protein
MRASKDPKVKQRALQAYRAGALKSEICAQFGIGTRTLLAWIAEPIPKPTGQIAGKPYRPGFRWIDKGQKI